MSKKLTLARHDDPQDPILRSLHPDVRELLESTGVLVVEFNDWCAYVGDSVLAAQSKEICGFYLIEADIIGLNMRHSDRLGRNITALHELIHWSGHRARLNRASLGTDDSYEEAVAYIGSAMLALYLGIHSPGDMRDYVDNARLWYALQSGKEVDGAAWEAVKFVLSHRVAARQAAA